MPPRKVNSPKTEPIGSRFPCVPLATTNLYPFASLPRAHEMGHATNPWCISKTSGVAKGFA